MWEGKSQARSQRVYIAKKKERKREKANRQSNKQTNEINKQYNVWKEKAKQAAREESTHWPRTKKERKISKKSTMT